MSNCLNSAVGKVVNPKAEKIFKNTVIFGKFALLALLLTLSFINGHKEYISENPRKFMWDNFAVGATSAVAIAAISLIRGRKDLIPNLAFISFLLFFAYNVFREVSGFNAMLDPAKLSQSEGKQRKFLGLPLFILMSVGVFVVLPVLAFMTKALPPKGVWRLIGEATILGSFTAAAEIVVAKNGTC
jgi:hypothetical protein